MIVCNTIAWIAYSFAVQDYFVFFANAPGLVMGLWLCISSFVTAPFEQRKKAEIALLVLLSIELLVFLVAFHTVTDEDTTKLIVGALCVSVLLVYYSAPLSTIVAVLKTRSSASLQLILCVANTVNGGLWTVYGLATSDAFIWGPNSAGAFLGCAQIALIFIFPSRSQGKGFPARRTLSATELVETHVNIEG
eukprot:scaffold412_cov388-Prasinococcus_capsulatus_cf.AAC.12